VNPRHFFAELKRRNVYKVAVAYAVVAWLLMQIATQIFPFFEIPNWAIRLVVLLLILGFPVALILAWAFELTPEGIKRADEVTADESTTRKTGRKLVGITVALAVIAAGLLVFRLVGTARWVVRTGDDDASGSRRTASLPAPGKSIAVLPFVDMSQSKDQEYFCDGISEEILNALAKVEGLRVVARTSSFSLKGKNADVSEVGKKLNVENVLEGSLRREGNRIRITAQLINARDGFHLWSETYERELQGVFAVQDEITRAIVNALKIKLAVALPVNKKPNSEAHELDLKGRYFLNKRDMRRAIDYFHEAITRDSNDALAYAGLSESYLSLSVPLGHVAPREAMPKAKEAALHALAIDDGLGEAHASLAYVTFFYDWDWAAAEREFQRAIELNPNDANAHHWYSHYLIAQGRIAESLTQSKRALELSPFDVLINLHLAWHYYYARQYDQALLEIEKTMEMDKRFVDPWFGLILEQKGRYAEEIAEFQKQIGTSPGRSSVDKAALARAYAISGQREAAEKIIAELQELAKSEYVSSFEIAAIYDGLYARPAPADKDQAFAWLEKAYEERAVGLVNLTVEPRFDRLRSDPRFTELERRMGLSPPK
jgi:serine/threonine-protein kinase